METGRLDGTRALVTGATSGIGLAIAEALSEAGARVVLTSRDAVRAEAAAARTGPEAIGLELDVRSEASVERCISEAYARWGGLDVVVSNAGIGMRTVNPRFMTEPQPFWAVSPDGFRDVLETKVTGSFLVARSAAPRMLAAGGGRIIVISMNEATMTRRGFIPYGPSGAAVEAAARVMAGDLAGSQVTVNIVLPGGATATGMVPDGAPPEIRANLLDPSIMGPPVVWLASDAAAGVHDQRIVATEFDPSRPRAEL
jgi:NAD(P)-dependent dehydrogenase (short-subunit alcohol dehydrogenase family)